MAEGGGPSPRGWGNLTKAINGANNIRAIPTRVGKSRHISVRLDYVAGHPHAGGEIPSFLRWLIQNFGPSPRGWGNLNVATTPKWSKRAIPTRVGKSLVLSRLTLFGRGPSPRGWGNRFPRSGQEATRRAIPTRVGKSLKAVLSKSELAGHPHAGGEIRFLVSFFYVVSGPSPRGWGNP